MDGKDSQDAELPSDSVRGIHLEDAVTSRQFCQACSWAATPRCSHLAPSLPLKWRWTPLWNSSWQFEASRHNWPRPAAIAHETMLTAVLRTSLAVNNITLHTYIHTTSTTPHPLNNLHLASLNFYRLGALLDAQTKVSRHWKHITHYIK